jgi:hypothetical protein
MKVVVATNGTNFCLSYSVILEYCKLMDYDAYPYCNNYDDDLFKLSHDVNELDAMHNVYILNKNYGDILKVDSITDDMWLRPDEIIRLPHTKDRTNPYLIKAIENVGIENAGMKKIFDCKLKIHDIPDDVKWKLEQYDMGGEAIREVSRIWN